MSVKAHQIMAWLSPTFPTGAFAYSHGLEQAVAVRSVACAEDLQGWLETVLRRGSPWNDAVLFCHAHQGEDVADLAEALAGSRERHAETMAQGAAFARTANVLLGTTITPAPLPVVLAQASALAGFPADEVLPLYLHAFAANLVSAAIRLVPLGQTEGQIVLAALFPVFDEVARKALGSGLEDLGTAALGADLAAMKHEDMTTRIFRS
ncbi:urease accessory protein UreF [Roseibium sediminis]|uniref:urease accessory protein UreF n=1 Tax=Roseibium sediminis TaxID=1775174 RepID=UPI00123E3C51|nr:urease accessory UreF family protein [Roseibium sediminis]